MRAQQLLHLIRRPSPEAPRGPRTRATRLFAGLALVLLFGGTACRTSSGSSAGEEGPTGSSGPVRLLLTADLAGYLEPCGCVDDMLGGLPRTAARIEALSAAGPTLFLDAGHTLPPFSEAKGAARAQTLAKAQTVVDLLRQLGVHTPVAPTDRPLERQLGRDWQESRLGEPGNGVTAKIFRVGGQRILVGQVSHDALPESGTSDAVLAGRIRDLVASAIGTDAPPDFRILLMTTGANTARRVAPLIEGDIDLISVSGLDAVKDGERARLIDAAVPIVRPISQGRGLAVVELRVPESPPETPRSLHLAAPHAELPPETVDRIARFQEKADAARASGDLEGATFYEKKIASVKEKAAAAAKGDPWPADRRAFQVTFETISADLPEAPWAKERIRRYDEEVAEANLRHSREFGKPCPSPPDAGPAYVGGETCAGCHGEATAFWKTTSHASAWLTLVQVEKTGDLECVGCHLTGWQRDGGVCRLHLVERSYGGDGAGGVQCEACHGAGSQHVASGGAGEIRREPPPGLCRQCHRGLHSPDFDPATYRAKILGPGHGAPMANDAAPPAAAGDPTP